VALRFNGTPVEVEIVGVVGALRHERLDEPPRPELVMPLAQRPSGSMTFVARTTLDPRTLIESGKQAVWTVDPLQTFYRTATLEELVSRTVSTRRFALMVLAGFAAVALLLAASGLYGVLTAVAAQYRREIGVRMAMGARWIDILRLVLGRGLVVVFAGLGMGLVGSLGGLQLLRRFLYGVAPTDPWALGGAALTLLLVAAPACLLPARRAAGADPSEALRSE
jgi:putative ABC transport system permease protein